MPVPENAQAGWDAYKASDYEMTLAEINDDLAARDLAPVSQRMYTHYRKLHRYGYEQYIPINQLDVRTMEDPVWDRALRGRYPLYKVEEPVRVLLLRDDKPIELPGVAEEVSDGEVILRLPGDQALDTFEQAKGRMWSLELVFSGTGEIRLCEVAKVTLDRRRERVTVRATFVGFDASEEVLVREPLPTASFSLVVGSDGGSPLLGRTAQQLFWLFSGTEGVRIAVAELTRSLDEEHRFAVPGNRVERLSVASPLDALIVAAGPVLLGFGLLLSKVVDTRKSWWEGTKAKHEAAAAEEDVLRLRWERSRREAIAAVGVEDVASAIATALRGQLGLPTADAVFDDDDPALKALATQALPAISELVEAGDGSVAFEEVANEDPGFD
jgi:hypothetical protein